MGRLAVAATLLLTAVGFSALIALQPVEFARSDTYSEGPVFDYAGNLYFSHGGGISKVNPDKTVTLWAADAGNGYNGHKVLPDGTHLVCAGKRGAVVRLDANGKLIGAVSTECEGKPLRAPNDLTLDTHGGFYFSDPGGSREAPIGTVHYVDRVGVTHLAAADMRVPNGLVLSPDSRFLYVAETQYNRILRFRIAAPGRLEGREIFAELPSRSGHAAEPDGLATDREGRLYVAHLGMTAVQVLDGHGKLVRTLPAGNYDASNLVFGGPELRLLFITGSVGHRSKTPGRVYRLELPDVRGISSLLPGDDRPR